MKREKTKESFDPKLGAGAAFMKHAMRRGLIVRVINEAETADLPSRLEKTFEDTAAWITRQPQTD